MKYVREQVDYKKYDKPMTNVKLDLNFNDYITFLNRNKYLDNNEVGIRQLSSIITKWTTQTLTKLKIEHTFDQFTNTKDITFSSESYDFTISFFMSDWLYKPHVAYLRVDDRSDTSSLPVVIKGTCIKTLIKGVFKYAPEFITGNVLRKINN